MAARPKGPSGTRPSWKCPRSPVDDSSLARQPFSARASLVEAMIGLVQLLRERMRMVREDAQAVARVVEEAFQGRSELDDELLHKDVRKVFYDLQSEKILVVRREDAGVDDVARRQYLCSISDDLPRDEPMPPAPDPAERLYHRLDDEAWERRRAPQ